MSSQNTSALLRFVTKQLHLSVTELLELRDALNAHVCERLGIATATAATATVTHERRTPRTLYLPRESMREL
jgi:hypothetical protein